MLNRSNFLSSMLIGLLVLIASNVDANDRSNIVLIVADDLG
ncbi:hypothetical protein [Rhodopirellula bahusiensis]